MVALRWFKGFGALASIFFLSCDAATFCTLYTYWLGNLAFSFSLVNGTSCEVVMSGSGGVLEESSTNCILAMRLPRVETFLDEV